MPALVLSSRSCGEMMDCYSVSAFSRFPFPVLAAKIHSAKPSGRHAIHRLIRQIRKILSLLALSPPAVLIYAIVDASIGSPSVSPKPPFLF
jgi:hypothetical protein